MECQRGDYDRPVTISPELAIQLRHEGMGSAFWIALRRYRGPAETLLLVEEPDVAIHVSKEQREGKDYVSLLAHGDARRVAEILSAASAQLPRPSLVMVPREMDGLLTPELDAWLPRFRGSAWDFFWTDRPLARRDGQERVELLSAEEARALIPGFLRQSNPSTDALTQIDEHSWWVIREGSVLAAVGAEDRGTIRDLRIVHLAGLGTLPTERGRGLGSALMAGVAEQLLGSYDLVTFGMWAKNDRARRVYDALGYINGARNLMMSDQPFSEEPDLAEE